MRSSSAWTRRRGWSRPKQRAVPASLKDFGRTAEAAEAAQAERQQHAESLKASEERQAGRSLAASPCSTHHRTPLSLSLSLALSPSLSLSLSATEESVLAQQRAELAATLERLAGVEAWRRAMVKLAMLCS